MKSLRKLPPWLVAIPVTLTLFSPLLRGEVLFWGLPSMQFVPWQQLVGGAIRAGQLPTWNPYSGAGAPLLANYQSAIFYPPNWLHVLLPAHLAIGIIGIAHLLWAAWGMWQLMGELGVPTFGRSVSALAYPFSGYIIARFGTLPMVDVAAWLPWTFWAVHRLMMRRTRRDAAVLALIVSMQLLAGHAQLTFYTLLGAGLYALWQTASIPRRSQQAQALCLTLGSVLLGAVIASVQLIPTAELLHTSQRAGGLGFDHVMNYSYGPMRILSQLTPHFFGTPANGSYIGKGAYWEDAAYIGFLPLVLALVAVGAWARRHRRPEAQQAFAPVPFFALIAIAATLLAFGRYTPLYRFLFYNVPTFDTFQAPARWLLLSVFALSALAGIGTLGWGRGKWTFYGSRLATAGGAGIVAMALLAPRFLPENAALETLTAAVTALGSWLVGTAVLTLAQPDSAQQTRLRWWQVAVIVFIAADLAWAWQGANPTVPMRFYNQRDDISTTNGRAYWFEDYEKEVFNRWLTFNDYSTARDGWQSYRRSMLPNLNALDRVALLNNFDPMRPGGHVRYLELIEAAGPERAGALLRAAGVGTVYSQTAPPGWTGKPGRWTAPEDAPRAWLAPDARWFPDQAALEAYLHNESWDPAQTVLLIGEAVEQPPANTDAPGSVEIIEDEKGVRLRIEAEAPAWLVLADTWYPGWTVRVDDTATEIYRANLTFRAVRITTGTHDVSFRYNTLRLLPGLLLTLSGLGICLTLATPTELWRQKNKI